MNWMWNPCGTQSNQLLFNRPVIDGWVKLRFNQVYHFWNSVFYYLRYRNPERWLYKERTKPPWFYGRGREKKDLEKEYCSVLEFNVNTWVHVPFQMSFLHLWFHSCISVLFRLIGRVSWSSSRSDPAFNFFFFFCGWLQCYLVWYLY